MRYVGGKGKIAREISEAILSATPVRDFYLEPFVGGGATFQALAPHFGWSVGGDLQEDLILMWNALIFDGWEPPTSITEDSYVTLRSSSPSPLRGFAGTGGSFGGKWFGGYARGGKNADGSPRNHQAESARSLIKTRDSLRSTRTPSTLGRFRFQSFADWNPIKGTVVYCDPPYADSQGYSTGGFDHKLFWQKCREWNEFGCEVFVSEYAAPEDFTCIWEKPKRQSLTTPEQGRGFNVERLFRL